MFNKNIFHQSIETMFFCSSPAQYLSTWKFYQIGCAIYSDKYITIRLKCFELNIYIWNHFFKISSNFCVKRFNGFNSSYFGIQIALFIFYSLWGSRRYSEFDKTLNSGSLSLRKLYFESLSATQKGIGYAIKTKYSTSIILHACLLAIKEFDNHFYYPPPSLASNTFQLKNSNHFEENEIAYCALEENKARVWNITLPKLLWISYYGIYHTERNPSLFLLADSQIFRSISVYISEPNCFDSGCRVIWYVV